MLVHGLIASSARVVEELTSRSALFPAGSKVAVEKRRGHRRSDLRRREAHLSVLEWFVRLSIRPQGTTRTDQRPQVSQGRVDETGNGKMPARPRGD